MSSLIDEVAVLRARRLTPKQIAKKLGRPRTQVDEIVRKLAMDAKERASSEPAPLHTCLVSPGWSDALILESEASRWRKYDPGSDSSAGGMAVILVARSERSQLSVATYLVDTWARGVRNAIGPRRMSELELAVFRKAAFSGFGGRSVSAPIELARALVFGAEAYADRFGFRPHPDFEKARPLLGDGSVEEGIRFGRGGSPFIVSKLDDVDDLEIDEHDWNDKQADSALAGRMVPFASLCPEIAELETRSVILPHDEYSFTELYCADPRCDCRRVLFAVVSRRADAVQAWINHGFEGAQLELDLPQTFLNVGSEQSANAGELLALLENVLLRDPDYRARLRRHYALFKEAALRTHP